MRSFWNYDSINLNEEVPFTIELVEGEKDNQITQVEEAVDSKTVQVEAEKQQGDKNIVEGKSGEKVNNSLSVFGSSFFGKVKVGFKNVTEGIARFFKEAASLTFQKRELEKATRKIEESKRRVGIREQAVTDRERALAAREEQFDKIRREKLGFNENVPEDRIKAEEYMCERFGRLNSALRHYYQTYLSKDSQIQFDDSEKEMAIERLRGWLIAELALLSGILDNDEILIFAPKKEQQYTFKKLKERLGKEGIFKGESKWLKGKASDEMEKRYDEGIKGMIKLGIFCPETEKSFYFDAGQICRELFKENLEREKTLRPKTYILGYQRLEASAGVRRGRAENPVHESPEVISKTVEDVLGFIEENDSER